ncbi:hypothetical protein [Mycoplasma phage sp.]|uniref:Uncharacterized protein n=1 Tax=Mycoplasmopsis anatis 1340 TaxID=1034808 RepID=F9QDI7_9BACT|nr:hypothetical protein [Mycoplasmopsis anatis]QRI43885.1 hypothetical protein [Mycoplasma phage sp.]AWX70373.1 hypothetical protein DP067_03385 [Mycoplasmopsis anatis]EGS29203.1 hypothetical protein GIG_02473 [Mycoplasmopsis anatis 1340]QRI43946.1 hypothetical protein [Mycoplasma phage sp.]QRI43981.1 hypothetical protein [Mycoplasma phage sp.]
MNRNFSFNILKWFLVISIFSTATLISIQRANDETIIKVPQKPPGNILKKDKTKQIEIREIIENPEKYHFYLPDLQQRLIWSLSEKEKITNEILAEIDEFNNSNEDEIDGKQPEKKWEKNDSEEDYVPDDLTDENIDKEFEISSDQNMLLREYLDNFNSQSYRNINFYINNWTSDLLIKIIKTNYEISILETVISLINLSSNRSEEMISTFIDNFLNLYNSKFFVHYYTKDNENNTIENFTFDNEEFIVLKNSALIYEKFLSLVKISDFEELNKKLNNGIEKFADSNIKIPEKYKYLIITKANIEE